MRESGAQRPIDEAQGEEDSYGGEGEMSSEGEDEYGDEVPGTEYRVGMREVPHEEDDQTGQGEEDEGEYDDESMIQSQVQGNEGLEQRLEQIKANIKKQRAETEMLSDQLTNSIAAKEFQVRNQKTLEELEEELADQK